MIGSNVKAANPSGVELSPPVAGRSLYSLATLLTLGVLMVQARFWAPYWDTHNVQAILTWDAMGYYLYLPAHFIYHDLHRMAFIPQILTEYAPTAGFYQAFQVPGGPAGNLVMKYPCGLAILEFPWFWIGHWAARGWGYPQDGFSAPYQIAIAFGGIAYSIIGLAVLRKVLLRYFPDLLTTLTLIIVVLGTNYFQYAVFDTAMAHNTSFTLYAVLLWCTIRWHESPRWYWAAGIGLALGLGVIVRPSEMVAVLIPLFWGIDSRPALRHKLALARHHWSHVALAIALGLLAVMPQLAYWKWATGHWLFYSYQEQGFSWWRPHLWQVLFSFKKGWLIYTPLMILALAGLWVLWRQRRPVAVPILIYCLVNLWVVSAWDIWWYGGSIGQRALVQSYAALSLPLAALLGRWPGVPTRGGANPPLRYLLAWPILALFTTLNLFQTWQYMRSIIHPDEMNRRYYWAVFNNAQPTQADYALLDINARRPGPAVQWQHRQVGRQTFDELPASAGGVPGEGMWHSTACRNDAEYPITPPLEIRVADLHAAPGAWLRGSCRVWSDWGAWNSRLVIQIMRGKEQLAWHGLRLQNNLSINQHWNHVYGDVPLADTRPDDLVRIYVLNQGGTPCRIDEVVLEVAERKPRSGF